MKTRALRTFIGALALVGLTAAASSAGVIGPPPPSLGAALRIKSGKVLIFQPVQMRREQSLVFTHLRLGDGSVKPGEQRAVQLVVYSSTPDPNGDFKVLASEIQVIAGAGPGSGPHVRTFGGYSPDTETQGIIAILIGLLLPADPADPAKIIPLPATDVLSAEIRDPGGLPLLLPAVQRIRSSVGR